MNNRSRSRGRDQAARRVALVFATLIVAATTAAGQNAAQDYPQWRGKSGDGSASAFVAPSTWPDSLTRRWRIDVGEGYATPLVIGDTVYVFARRDGNEVLLAIDASSGAERWRSAYPLPYTPSSPTVAHGSGPKATPLFHEGKLFTLGISGILSAFDAKTGKRLWQTAAPAEVPFYSAASSPVGAKGDRHRSSRQLRTAHGVRRQHRRQSNGEPEPAASSCPR